jgi:hypothetical protein
MADARSFAEELSTVQVEIADDVGGILQAVKERKDVRASRPAPSTAREAEPPATELGVAADERPARSVRTHSRPRTEEPVVLKNVTTRLCPETDERLTEAALRQRLKKVEPATRQAIIETALRDWLRKQGYAK